MNYIRYLIYVLKHKYFVFSYCCALDIPWRGLTHDLSKFRPREFIPYARWFFGPHGKVSICAFYPRAVARMDFEYAWLKHQNANDHHPNYWVLGDRPLDMPEAAVKEMVADWFAAALAQGKTVDSVMKWFDDNIHDYKMTPPTFELAQRLVVRITSEYLKCQK